MSSSSTRINYKLRPAKAVERKLLCESFRHLGALARLDTFRYVGFGSLFFSDFVLFHRSLNIRKMVSIEQDTRRTQRYKFNVPYKCIDLQAGDSHSILPKLKWEKIPSIVWLDYDGELSMAELGDIQFLCSELQPPSVILVTVNANPGEVREGDKTRLDRLREAVGDNRIPSGVSERDLSSWGKARVLRQIIDDDIHAHISDRNGRIETSTELVTYSQLFNFTYADNAKMLTVGGLIYRAADKDIVEGCGFSTLDWWCPGAESFNIAVPILTVKELKHLDVLLPKSNGGDLKIDWLEKQDIDEYQRIYRYFPTFTEAADL